MTNEAGEIGRTIAFFGLVVTIVLGGCGVVQDVLARGHETAVGGDEAAEWRPGPSEDPEDVGGGSLLWKRRDGFVRLPTLDTHVELEVTAMLVRGQVTQRFANPTDEVIEALYVFPLPDTAAVHQMEMRIGPRRIRAVVQEKREAERTYATAKQEGKKAALVHQERPNLFTTAAANINPGESIEVILEYLQESEYVDSEFRLRFPLTFTPRYAPPPGAPLAGIPDDSAGVFDAVSAAKSRRATGAPFVGAGHPAAPRIRVRARIDAGVPLEDVTSGSHSVRTFLDGDVWEIETDGIVLADRDFTLRWRPLVNDRPAAALFTERRADGDYALLMLVPPEPTSGDWGLPTETVFVVDVSSSMAGPSIVQAREALLAALDRLRPGDTFNIFKFNDATEAFSDRFEPAVPDALDRARAWVRGLRATGGTRIHPALVEALALARDGDRGRVQRLIFLTDGAVSNEDEMFREIAGRLGAVRLHTLGIGHAPNTHLMRKMATFGRGVCEFVAEGAEAGNRIDAFFARIDRPVMSGLELHWDGPAPEERYPARLPDLYPGQPLLLSLRLAAGAAPTGVALHGRLRDDDVRTPLDLSRSAGPGSGVAVRWARAKVRSRMDALHEGADPAMVRRDVVDIGLSFHLVTRYTSLVAVEEFASALRDAETVRVANGLPAGFRPSGMLPVGGTTAPLREWIGVVLALAGGVLLLLLRGGTR